MIGAIQMGSVVSHFNVSLTVQGQVTRQCPSITIGEEKGEPKRESNRVPSANQPSALTTRPNWLAQELEGVQAFQRPWLHPHKRRQIVSHGQLFIEGP